MQYTDPERLHLASIAATYFGRPDTNNTQRPLTLIKNQHDSFLKSQFVRFEYESSIASYNHLATYTLATACIPMELRACKTSRVLINNEYILPQDMKNPEKVESDLIKNITLYHNLTETESIETARYLMPQGISTKYTISWSFLLLAKHFFPDRLWGEWIMAETKLLAQMMWDHLISQDKDLWESIKSTYKGDSHENSL